MQSKGIIRVLAILIAIACIWQLSFTFVARHYDNKAEKESRAHAEQFFADNFSSDPAAANKFLFVEGNEQYIQDTLASNFKKRYIDSLSKLDVYFRYTYKDVKEKEINLGLDLRGGMNITLQLRIEDLLVGLAQTNATNEFFTAALAEAQKDASNSAAFIEAFDAAWKAQRAKEGCPSLGQLFSLSDTEEDPWSERSDAQIISVLNEKAKAAIASARKVFENRVKRLGVTQPEIREVGESGRILIELPGVKEPERVKKILGGTASLEFWETYNGADIRREFAEADRFIYENTNEVRDTNNVNPLSSLLITEGASGACIGYAVADDTLRISRYIRQIQEANAVEWPTDFRAYWEVKGESRISASRDYFGLVAIKAGETGVAPLDGSAIANASIDTRNNGQVTVSMSMNSDGTRIWAGLTERNAPGRRADNGTSGQIAVVLDNLVYSYPVVNEAITGGRSEISGGFTMQEAQDLVNVLLSGTLPVGARIIHSEVVGPSLGQESINNGLLSFAIAFCLVLLYMIFFYQGAGIIADIALLVNVLFLIGTLVSFNLVLTLPGIAGLVLTLGMAVDANVIIYERIKEEIAAGKGLGKAVADGYRNAYSAILDGQITTLLTGIILFLLGGNGPVRGFATTLMIGIITSIVTSIFITRIIIDDRLVKGRKISFENNLTKNFLKNTKVDFVSKRKFSYIFSGILIVLAIGSISLKGFTYGVDFKGGRNFIVKFDQPVKAQEVRSAVTAQFEGSSTEVKQYGGETQLRITTTYGLESREEGIDKEVQDKLYEALLPFYATPISQEDFEMVDENSPNGIVTSEMVSPSIASETTNKALWAVALALVVIFTYIAIRFKGLAWGVGGVTSLAHTAIIIIGFVSLLTGILPFNLDVDQTFIAAILTIIGYAINDNVVIFDRIREYKTLHPKAEFKDTVNTAVNATLTRTVNTSVSSLLPMLTIAIFGGEAIRGLAVALCLGIIIGTYASIMIGTPVMYDVYTAREKRKAAKKAAARR